MNFKVRPEGPKEYLERKGENNDGRVFLKIELMIFKIQRFSIKAKNREGAFSSLFVHRPLRQNKRANPQTPLLN